MLTIEERQALLLKNVTSRMMDLAREAAQLQAAGNPISSAGWRMEVLAREIIEDARNLAADALWDYAKNIPEIDGKVWLTAEQAMAMAQGRFR